MRVFIKKGGLGGPTLKADGSRTYRRTYRVVSSRGLYESQVRNAPGLPARLQPHPGDPDAFCESLEFRESQEHPGVWDVEATWSTAAAPDSDKDKPPLERSVVVKWSVGEQQEWPLVDLDGKPYLTSAGIRFASIQPHIRPYLILSLQQNVGQIAPDKVLEYHDAVNSDRFLEFPKHTVKLRITGGEAMFALGQWYHEITWELWYNPAGWHPRKYLDAATHQLVAGANGQKTLVPILDQWGNPVSDAWPLDGEGKALSIARVNAGDVVFREFREHKLLRFSGVVPPSNKGK